MIIVNLREKVKSQQFHNFVDFVLRFLLENKIFERKLLDNIHCEMNIFESILSIEKCQMTWRLSA